MRQHFLAVDDESVDKEGGASYDAAMPQKMSSEIRFSTTPEGGVDLELHSDADEILLSTQMMADLFGTSHQSIAEHIHSLISEGALDPTTLVKKDSVDYYPLDAALAVGYRVNSMRGAQFRTWVAQRLSEYLLRGYVVHEQRMRRLGQVFQLQRRAADKMDGEQVQRVIESYSRGLDLLDAYDHQRLTRPAGTRDSYHLGYEECRELIESMRFSAESDLFGREKDDSYRGSLGNIYQSFGGQELYPTLEEKAARLLYFTVKNHGFSDGNKRIAAATFLHFLARNHALYTDTGAKRMTDATLVALVILIAESRPEEMETIISVILNCMAD